MELANKVSDKDWKMPSGMRIDGIKKLIPSEYILTKSLLARETLVFYDTFDWKLWFSDMLLYRSRDEVHLVERNDEWMGEAIGSYSAEKKMPRFWWEFHNPELKLHLKSSLKLRALMPVATFCRSVQTLEMRNKDDKIVVRANIESYYPLKRPRAIIQRVCRTLPMRGYDQEAAKLEDALRRGGFLPLESSPLKAWFVKNEIQPDPHTVSPEFEFPVDMPARDASRALIKTFLGIARSNEPGIIDDIDTEFLHHYRVAFRKIRSALSLLKEVFPERTCRHLKSKFASLVKRTNRMRDLDVYLLSRESYEELLPCSLRPGVSEMFDEMEKERNVELKKVKRHLRSKTYKKQMHSLEKFFKEEDNLEASENSLVVIKPFVAKRILKIYGKICEISKDLAQDTPDENIHALRIQCKKMRYMLEFFSHLFDTGGIRILGKSLKSLQDKLGVFNDLSVQQISLLHYIKAKNYRHASPDLYLAVGGMISALHAKYLLQREAVLDGLDEFSCEKNQKLCQKLFKMTEKAK